MHELPPTTEKVMHVFLSGDSAGRPTFSIEISEFWEAFLNFRKSGNSFPDFRNFGRFLTTGTVFGPIPNIMYDTDFLFIAVVRRMFQKRRGSRSCIPKRVTNPSEILGRFPKFGKVPKFWEGSQNLGRFPNSGKVPKIWEGSQILGTFPNSGKVPKFWEALQKGKEGIKLLQSKPTDLRALFLDHAGIHVLLLPRLPLVPCDPRVSCPVMHTKSTLETFVPKKKTGTCCDDCDDCNRVL